MRRLFAGLRPPADLTDRHLLDRFRLHRDEAAFAELVRRHGPLVWGVCRRTLSPTDADDAFQATFLLLLRKPPAGEVLAPWLYRVAVLTARTARRAERRRWGRVRVGLPADEPATPVRDDRRDEVDAALMGLSARDRAAVVLCHLDGHTRAEAAKLLGVPEGTLSARLSRAMAKLRLGRDPAAVLAVAGAGLVPSGLAAAAVRAGVLYLAGGAVPPAVATITRGVLTMGVLKSVTVAGLLLAAVAGAGVGVGLRAGPDDKPAAKPADDAVAAAAVVADAERRLVIAQYEREFFVGQVTVLQAARQKTEATVVEARQALAAAVAKATGRPDRRLTLRVPSADLLGAGFGMFTTAPFVLVEPGDNGSFEYAADTPASLVRLLARTRAALADLPLGIECGATNPRRQTDELLRAVRAGGYTTAHYTGPDWHDLKGLAAGPGRGYEEQLMAYAVQPADAPIPTRRMYSGFIDLTKLK